MAYDDDLFKDSTMTFGEHIEELRKCLIKALLGLAIGFLIGLLIGDRVVKFIQIPVEKALVNYYQTDPNASSGLLGEKWLVDPLALAAVLEGKQPPERTAENPVKPNDLKAIHLYQLVVDSEKVRPGTLNAQEAFGIYVMAALVAGLVFSSPWVFYHVWSFVAAGLYPHEKKYVHLFLPVSLGLFLAGAALAFFFVFEPVLDFLFSFNRWMNLKPDVRISEWMSFVLMLPIGFGIAFQLPLVMMFLERIQIVTVQMFIEKWRISVLVIFIVSMVLTPADPYSMLLMAVPLCILYGLGILLIKYLPRAHNPYEEPATTKVGV